VQEENLMINPGFPKMNLLRWPEKILGPAPGLKELNLACWSLFVGLLITRFGVPLAIQFKRGAGPIHILPADFIYFYGVGRIANQYPLTKLYDYSLQLKIFNEIYRIPLHDGAYGPSPYPPFVGLFFSLFARLPIIPAYFLWAFVSLTLYVAGIAAAVKAVFPVERLKISLLFCFALAFAPFLYNTLANGQLASIAVFSVGFAILLERQPMRFSSGLALSLLAYKPTLLLLVVPMLLITRRFRTFSGFVTGAALLGLLATAFGGLQIWRAYFQFLSFFGRFVGLGGQSILALRQFIDFKTFIQAVCGGWSKSALIFLISITILIAASLAVLLWKSAKSGRPAQSMAWAATLTWTLLLNGYIPVYDSILATIAVVLTLGALKDIEWKAATGWIISLAVLMSAASWELDTIAQDHGIQFLTAFLTILGVGQLYILYRMIRLDLPARRSALLQSNSLS
jgi:hypothetical protein